MIIPTPTGALYAYSGGRAFDPQRPCALFIHGVLNDHSVWALQSRYLAHHGWSVAALDLPGHARSTGPAPQTTEAAASAVLEWIAALGVERVALIGHSWGSLIALEAAAQLGPRVLALALLGTAAPMRVAPALLQAAAQDPERAMRMVAVYSRATLAAPPSVLGPGTWPLGAHLALQRRVLASNRSVNIFERGFQACDRYDRALQAIAAVPAPVAFILGQKDQMTPPRAAQSLIDAARARPVATAVQVSRLDCGHNLMLEAPGPTLDALLRALPDPAAL